MACPQFGAGGVVAQTCSLLLQRISSISRGSVAKRPRSSRTPFIGGSRPKIDLPILKWSANGFPRMLGPLAQGGGALLLSVA